jgi:hypothetical protein
LSQDKTKFFLLCEFLAGRSLEDLLLTEGPMPEDDAVAITMQTLGGLQAVHEVTQLCTASLLAFAARVFTAADTGTAYVNCARPTWCTET